MVEANTVANPMGGYNGYYTLVKLMTEENVVGLQMFLDGKRILVDSRDENGQTPLMHVSQRGQLNFALDLLAHGADSNAVDLDNWTPLLNACKEGHDDIVSELLEHGAKIDHQDLGGWTGLMWACYKGRTDVVRILLHRGADPNIQAHYQISCLLWSAGRGYTEIVRELLTYGAKVGAADKYGTTALIWAARKGYFEIADFLLKSGANVDTSGMFSLTALLVATKGNFVDVVHLLLDYKPNLNCTDKDGCSSLGVACKEGYGEIAAALLHAGAYVNNHDRAGDTNLIHAVKAGHPDIVDALIKKYADADAQGTDKKSALYWAVEKGYTDIVRILLRVNPDLELATFTGDTALLRAVRNRNAEIVQILIDHKAKVSAVDKHGDTALHIAMRSRSKAIVEILLRNPKNSQLLYRPNKAGETPYNIDGNQQRNILGQIFGARRLNTNEDNENLLGYDLYSSALADFLSEPTLSMPICVGLYAKWGSGKSFLLGKLRAEMKNFAFQWVEPTYEWSMFVFLLVLHVAFVIGTTFGLAVNLWVAGFCVALAVFLVIVVLLFGVSYGNNHYDVSAFYSVSKYLGRKINAMKLFLLVVFCHPPMHSRNDTQSIQPIKFIFTDTARVTSATCEGSTGKIVSSMFSVLEKEYGVITTRLYKVFRPKPVKSVSWKFRRLCCVPNFFFFYLTAVSLVATLVLSMAYRNELGPDLTETSTGHFDLTHVRSPITFVLIAVIAAVGIIVIANACTFIKIVTTIVYPTKRRVARAAQQAEDSETKGKPGMASLLLQPLQSNVQLVSDMVKCIDAFTGNQTRVVIIVDSLDSCEQDKVLHNLDTVHLLFSNTQFPFITILAIDPHIIIKAIEANINRVFHDSSINGHDYLRNIIHLPFFLQNSGLRRVQSAQNTAQQFMQRRATTNWGDEANFNASSAALGQMSRRLSSESSMSIPDRVRQQQQQQQMRSKRLKTSDSIASSMSNIYRVTAAQDLTKVLLTDDYFSDVNPRSMRRLMNVVYITGRLLKAFNMDFNWYHLASWVNISEQWPYRTSWIILYYEKCEDELEDVMSLKAIYDKIKKNIPTSKEIEPLLEIDRDERKFEIFLSFHKSSLQVAHLKMFLPFTISLDPYIRKIIKEEQHNLEEIMKMEGVPLHPPGRRIPSMNAPAHWLNQSHSEVHVPSGGYFNRPTPYHMANANRQMGFINPLASYPQEFSTSYSMPFGWSGNGTGGFTNPAYGGYLPQSFSGKNLNVPHTSGKKLTELSVNDVCDLLVNLDSVEKAQIAKYRETLQEHNVNGRVLMHCDMDELKKVMFMSFGDWELFRIAVLQLRNHEMEGRRLESSDAGPRTVRLASVSGPPGRQPTPRATEHHDGTHGEVQVHVPNATAAASGDNSKTPRDQTSTASSVKSGSTGGSQFLGVYNEVDKGVAKGQDGRGKRFTHQNTLEKQVTLEDQMICGVLQTLNEDAQEDALGVNDSTSSSSVMGAGGGQRPSIPRPTSSTTLSPILSDPEEAFQDGLQPADPNELQPRRETDVIYLVTPPISPSRGSRIVTEANLGAMDAGGTRRYSVDMSGAPTGGSKVKWEIGSSSPPTSPVNRKRGNSISSIASSVVSSTSERNYGFLDETDGGMLIASNQTNRYPLIIQSQMISEHKNPVYGGGQHSRPDSLGLNPSSSFDKLSRLKNKILGSFSSSDAGYAKAQSVSSSPTGQNFGSLTSLSMSRKSSLKKHQQNQAQLYQQQQAAGTAPNVSFMQQLSVQTFNRDQYGETTPLVGNTSPAPSPDGGASSKKSVDFHEELTPVNDRNLDFLAGRRAKRSSSSSSSTPGSPNAAIAGAATLMTPEKGGVKNDDVIVGQLGDSNTGYSLQSVPSEPFVVMPKSDSAADLRDSPKENIPVDRKRSSSETVV